MPELDPRLLQISLQVNNQLNVYNDLAIFASGMKYANPIQNEAEITIYNLDVATQNYILNETSPFNLNRSAKTVIVEAGRKSYGLSKVFQGNIITARPSQPPDIGVTLRVLTGNYLNGTIIARNQAGFVDLKTLAQNIALDCGLLLDFQAQNKQVSNYNYTGSALKQIEALAKLGNINVFVDNATLIMKNLNVPLTGVVTTVNLDNGMIGIPEVTEQGIKVKFLFNSQTRIGGGLNLTSTVYPALNGSYVIYKLGFELTNREVPFYLIAEARRLF